VREPWRHFVRDALQARARFERTVARTRPGPLRDRLAGLGRRLDDGVTECWRIACQGDALDSALDQLDAGAIEAELADVQARRQGAPADARGSLERAEQAIRAQLSSVQRIDRVSADARNRLLVLNAQLDEAVARAVELSLRAGDTSELSPLSDDVDSLVSELESLRQALEETVPSGGLAP
jgi:DNA-binding FrmR family transcriptional regulator